MEIRRIDYKKWAGVYTSKHRTPWRKIKSLDSLIAILHNLDAKLECEPYLTCDEWIAIYVHGKHPTLGCYIEYVVRFNPFRRSDRAIFRDWYKWQTGERPA